MDWFSVDKHGLAKLLERRGLAFSIFELISNCLDTLAKTIRVRITPVEGVPKVEVEVEDDDPTGFSNLTHAFTLFAESIRKGDAEKRGRFNLGEKITLALCETARIESTTGTVIFDKEGRHSSRQKREKGSRFFGVMRMTRDQYNEVLSAVATIIPPPSVELTVNGVRVQSRDPLTTTEATLPTEIADAEGVLRRTTRKTTVRVYEALPHETPTLYELGIPVVETGDKWHVDVGQKIPLNLDRDNVLPSFLRQVRVLVLNALHDQLSKDDANATWVRDAGSDKNAAPEATKKILDLRFGEKRAAFDPNDPEANALAVSKGYTLVTGGMLNGQEWQNAKSAGAILPSSVLTPSPKPFSEDGEPQEYLDEGKWTAGMSRLAKFCKRVAFDVLDVEMLQVRITNDITWPFAAAYGQGVLIFNLGRVGHRFFDQGITPKVLALVIHEFGHHYGSNHLGEEYHEGLCKVGAEIAALALTQPQWFRE